jgi:L-aspartate oxidase
VIRGLPACRPAWDTEAEVVVVGSGAGGISAALAAATRGRRVLLLSKGELGAGATPLAQGGLAAAIGPGDSPALHARDTLAAGAGLSDPAAVATLVDAAPAEIGRLAGLGAALEREALRLEGGHSRHRIVAAGGDATGAEVHRVLTQSLLASPVELMTGAVALDLLTTGDGSVAGLLVGLTADDGQTLRVGTVMARAVVLATGGFGQAYPVTTSPAGMTGDGLALATRAGAELRDVEFVQFHPTVFWREGARGQCPLITEALRGAGAVLVDSAGRAVMAGRHPRADLAPRDVVSAVMAERIASGDGPGHLWLDATGVGCAALERGFPTVTALCRAHGVDPATESIPVAPGAHYTCGGIRAGLAGETSVPGLYAVGEAAATGVHGANRLASNSLTEALIAGRRTGEHIGAGMPGRAVPGGVTRPAQGPGVDPACVPALAAAMWRHAGVIRDGEGLASLLASLEAAPAAERGGALAAGGDLSLKALLSADRGLTLATVEATNLHTVSVLVGAAALARAESRGCHRRRDAPAAAAAALPTLMCWRDGRLWQPATLPSLAGAAL